MKLLEMFKNDLKQSGEETIDTIMHALKIVENFVQNSSNEDIIEFGSYFLDHYDDLTKERRLSDYNGMEPISIGTFKFIESTRIDQEFFDIYQRDFTKNEQFELISFKKELNELFTKHKELIMSKEIKLGESFLSNYFIVAPIKDFNLMDNALVDVFVKNAILSDTAEVTILLSNTNHKLKYSFINGHWISENGRKY